MCKISLETLFAVETFEASGLGLQSVFCKDTLMLPYLEFIHDMQVSMWQLWAFGNIVRGTNSRK